MMPTGGYLVGLAFFAGCIGVVACGLAALVFIGWLISMLGFWVFPVIVAYPFGMLLYNAVTE